MPRQKLVNSIGSAICAMLFIFAFVAAPHSCEWGLSAYFWFGVACLVVLFAIPLVLRNDRTFPERVAWGFGFAVVGMVVWLAGLFAANVRIMCRLF